MTGRDVESSAGRTNSGGERKGKGWDGRERVKKKGASGKRRHEETRWGREGRGRIQGKGC